MSAAGPNGRAPEEPAAVERSGPHPLGALPGIARLAASAAWHTTEWTVQNSFKASRRLLQAAASPESAATLVQDLEETARSYARELVGVADLEERVRRAAPSSTVAQAVAQRVARSEEPPPPASAAGELERHVELRRRGAGLMRLSSDVRYEEEAHPAYERILDELAPDEGRILRLLYLEGPQPAVDVRTGGPLGVFSSELIAPGLSMIGPRAGVRYLDRVPPYLNNLHRLGLVWFSRETLRDAHRYQVIEAQPDVLAAMKSVRFAKIVRRSIHLTPFGVDFCRDCLGLDGGHVPAHGMPSKEDAAVPPPES